jgi:hypothetical protein
MSKDVFKQLSVDDKLVTLFDMLTTNSLNTRIEDIEQNMKSLLNQHDDKKNV